MTNKTITAFFDNYEDASEAVRRLESAGIPNRDISLVASNEGERYSSHATRTFDKNSKFDDDVSDGAGTGATVGTLAGGGAGLLAGLGMLAIPGLGPVVAAGWLASTLVGAGAGAAGAGAAGAERARCVAVPVATASSRRTFTGSRATSSDGADAESRTVTSTRPGAKPMRRTVAE